MTNDNNILTYINHYSASTVKHSTDFQHQKYR